MIINITIHGDTVTHITDITRILNICESLRDRPSVDGLNVAMQFSNVSTLRENSLNPCHTNENSCSVSIMDLMPFEVDIEEMNEDVIGTLDSLQYKGTVIQ